MSGVWILLLLLVTGCDSHVFATFEVGDCIDIPRFRESWEERDIPYKILEIGERNYRVRFVKYLLNGGDHSLSFFNAAAVYEKVECPQ